MKTFYIKTIDEDNFIYYDKFGKIQTIFDAEKNKKLLQLTLTKKETDNLPEDFPVIMAGRNFVDELGAYCDFRYPIFEYKVDIDTKALLKISAVETFINTEKNFLESIAGVKIWLKKNLAKFSTRSDYITMEYYKHIVLGEEFTPSDEHREELEKHFSVSNKIDKYLKEIDAIDLSNESEKYRKEKFQLIVDIYSDEEIHL